MAIRPIMENVAKKVRIRMFDWLSAVKKVVRHPDEPWLEFDGKFSLPHGDIELQILNHEFEIGFWVPSSHVDHDVALSASDIYNSSRFVGLGQGIKGKDISKAPKSC